MATNENEEEEAEEKKSSHTVYLVIYTIPWRYER